MIPKLLNAQQVAEILGVSRTVAYREMQMMTRVELGRRGFVRVSEKAVEHYLENRTKEPLCAGSTRKKKTAPGTASTTKMGSGSGSTLSAGINELPTASSETSN